MKTFEELAAELREYADTDSQVVGRDVLRRELHSFADELKDTHKQEISQAYMRGLCEGVTDFCEKTASPYKQGLVQMWYSPKICGR